MACWSCLRERRQNTKLTVNKHKKGSEDWEWAGDKPLPEAGQVVDHKAVLLSQGAASKTELPHLGGGGSNQTAATEE
jgi:hypothetical protein